MKTAKPKKRGVKPAKPVKPAVPATADELARHELQGRLELLADSLRQIGQLAGATAFNHIAFNARNGAPAARAAARLVRENDRATTVAEAVEKWKVK
jgi:hypothetical protein